MGPLGISQGDCAKVDGVAAGGACEYWHWPGGMLTAEIQGKHVKLTPMFGPTARVLVGRADFFRVFKVAFDERNRRFRLDPY